METLLSPWSPAASWKKPSPTMMCWSADAEVVLKVTVGAGAGPVDCVGAPRGAAPDANAGIAMSAMTAHASHGRTDFLIPSDSPPRHIRLWTGPTAYDGEQS